MLLLRFFKPFKKHIINDEEWNIKLPIISIKLEDILYHKAKTFEEYFNILTLYNRIKNYFLYKEKDFIKLFKTIKIWHKLEHNEQRDIILNEIKRLLIERHYQNHGKCSIEYMKSLPYISKLIENHLYNISNSIDEYNDITTLSKRLHYLAISLKNNFSNHHHFASNDTGNGTSTAGNSISNGASTIIPGDGSSTSTSGNGTGNGTSTAGSGTSISTAGNGTSTAGSGTSTAGNGTSTSTAGNGTSTSTCKY